MKVVYMGTPDFAVPPIDALVEAGHEISYVVTQPDAVSGRGKKVRFSPVKAKALELGIPVLQPERVKGNEEFYETLKAAAPDIIIVAAYGQILPIDILNLPELGCVNIHASLLPRFRGASPIQASIMAGDENSGVTLMYMEEGLDTGDMIAKASTPIGKKTGEQLHDELAAMGAKLLIETLPVISEIEAEKQDDSLSTYAHMISKKDGVIDFTLSPEEIERKVRAFDPWPGTFTNLGDKVMKVWQAEVIDQETDAAAGTVISSKPEGIDVACGGRILRIKQLQMPGKRRVDVKEYLKGNSIETGTVLG